jgi:cell wall-associated NlpC family hydrolase
LPSKNIALVVCLLISAAAAANNKTYTVQQGDTITTIAKRFNVPTEAIVSENHLNKKHLRAGMVLSIPVRSEQAGANSYTIKAGDNDWILAHRLNTSIAKLHEANPNVDWHHLKPGSTIRIAHVATAQAPSINSRYAVVSAEHAIIRRGPSASEGKVTLVDAGTRVVVLDFDSGWYKLKFPKGTVGWMRGDLLKPVQAPQQVVAAVYKPEPAAVKHVEPVVPTQVAKVAVAVAPKRSSSDVPADSLLDKAFQLRGTRYRYGGLSSRSGLDCSGFTSTVFKAEGIKLPRTSRSQSTVGYSVNRGDLKPGDLVFFRTHRSSRINHVGIYAGNGKFIHAASGFGAVRVDNLNGHYAHELATARRVGRVRQSGGAGTELASKVPSAPTPKPAEPQEIPMVQAQVIAKHAIREPDKSGS